MTTFTRTMMRLIVSLAAVALAMWFLTERAAVVDAAVSNPGTQPTTSETQPPSKDAPTEPVLIACYAGLNC